MPSARFPTVVGVLVRDLIDGQELDQVLLVRGVERARETRRGAVPASSRSATARASSRRSSGTTSPTCVSCARRASRARRAAASRSHPRWGAQLALRGVARAPGHVRRGRSASTGRRARPRRWRPTCASSSPPCRTRTCARCSIACSARDAETWAALPPRARGQALPPGLRPRAARALADRRAGRQRVRRVVPGHRPRRRGHRRAAARHRQARGLHRRPGRDRPHRRRHASRARSRWATTACAARSRTLPGFPPDTAQAVLHIILSHHGSLEHGSPVVPVHARGVRSCT